MKARDATGKIAPVEENDGAPQANRAAKFIAVVAALVGGKFLNDWVYLRTENHPWGIGALVAVGVAAAVGFYNLQDWRAKRGPPPDRSWVAPIAILAVAAILGFSSGSTVRDSYVRPYCLYGAKSDAQYNGCMSHVTNEDIDRLDTQAAQFARGDTSECLEDAGPYCADASKWNTLEPDQ